MHLHLDELPAVVLRYGMARGMKRALALLLAGVLLAFSAACVGGNAASQGEDFPEKNISGIVQWGAGGGTDSLMRPLAALAEKELGVSIVVRNMPGAAGSIAAQYVYDAAADGYSLLMGAENPALYRALEISELTYADFDCVFLIGDEVVGIVVSGKSEYSSFTEIVAGALAAPGGIKLSTTGKGGLPWEVAAFIEDITGAVFNQIPYDSDASAKTAVLSGECDFTVCKVQSGIEDYRAGELRYLCMLALEPVPAMTEVPLITAEYPDFEKYLPWGPFYGVFIKGGADPAIVEMLSGAFSAAAADVGYRKVLQQFNVQYLGYTGEQAKAYIEGWQQNTINALQRSGALE